ncbi:TM2 domain-containing protein [Rickettsiales bacterium]|nr:TM2 domain-containing protein [Rickettsiales bacterium]
MADLSKKEVDKIRLDLEVLLDKDYLDLSEEHKDQLIELYARNRKTSSIYFWWFFNIHYAYVGKWGLFIIFFLTLGGLGIWWLIDLFRLSTILEEYNKKQAQELLEIIEIKRKS